MHLCDIYLCHFAPIKNHFDCPVGFCWFFNSHCMVPHLSHWTLLIPPHVPHPSSPSCLYLFLASPNSLQANTHCQLFLLLSHSDLTGEHSCPATVPPHDLFCFRLLPLSNFYTSFLPPTLFFPYPSHNSFRKFYDLLLIEDSHLRIVSSSGLRVLVLPWHWDMLPGALVHGETSHLKLNPVEWM